MSSVDDYLAKQLFIDKNVVTFRSLSRQLNIHVNEAKKALQVYHSSPQSPSERCYATYILSGEPNPRKPKKILSGAEAESEMNVDSQDQSEPASESDGEVVPHTEMMLVGEDRLESAKANFMRIYSQHVYSLSPAPLMDPALICAPSAQVYAKDASLSADSAVLLGRITGPHVTLGKYVRPPVATKGKEPISRAPTKEKVEEKEKPSTPIKAEPEEARPPKAPAPIAKAKSTGKLDWSKAKVKGKEGRENKGESSLKQPVKKGPPPKEAKGKMKDTFFGPNRGSSKTDSSDTSPPLSKRGIKRKSVHESSDSDDSKPPPSSSPAPEREVTPAERVPRVKKGVVYSDDEETTDTSFSRPTTSNKPKGKARLVRRDTETERSLKAMMEINDDEVIKASRPQKEVVQEEITTDEDVSMEDEVEAEPEPELEPEPTTKSKARKKREKKVVPIGQNGLKKKRVVKSRIKLDEKGYTVTEDYSEYESVDEEEPEEPKPRRGQKAAAKGKNVPTEAAETKAPKPKPLQKSESRKLKPGAVKRTNSTKTGTSRNGSLMSFFEKK